MTTKTVGTISSVSALGLQGGSCPSWERKRLLSEEHRALPGCPHHQHPQNSQILTDSTSWGSRTLIFPALSPHPQLSIFFPFLKIIKLAENWLGLVATGQGVGDPLKNSQIHTEVSGHGC